MFKFIYNIKSRYNEKKFIFLDVAWTLLDALYFFLFICLLFYASSSSNLSLSKFTIPAIGLFLIVYKFSKDGGDPDMLKRISILIIIFGIFSPFLLHNLYLGSPDKHSVTTTQGTITNQATTTDTISVENKKPLSNLELDGQMGPIGDWLAGTSAPLINLATFLMIFATFLSQRQELRLTTEALDAQKDELAESRKISELQTVEGTIFNLLSLNNEIINSMEIIASKYSRIARGYVEDRVIGRRTFSILYNELKKEMEPEWTQLKTNAQSKNVQVTNLHLFKYTRKKYMKVYNEYEYNLGHYFRNIYHIVNLIDKSEVLKEQRKQQEYINFVKAQLSSYELIALFYNAIGEYGFKNFYPLMIKYDLLQNMNKNLIIVPEQESIYENLSKFTS